MSDLSIPGLTSRYNTNEIVQGLVEAESTRLNSLETNLDTLEVEKRHWQEINRNLASLQTGVKKLFGFENPFNEKVVQSSNEAILTATADRTADLTKYNIKVLQLASNDRFLSASMDDEYRVPGGDYEFQVGEEDITFRFRGGKLQDFARQLNDQSEDLLRATVVRETADSLVMLKQAIPTGSSNRLFFKGESLQLAKDISMIRQIPAEIERPNFQNMKTLSTELPADSININNEEITLRHGARVEFPLDSTFPIEDGTILKMEIKVVELADDQLVHQQPTPPELPSVPGISFQGIKLDSAGMDLSLPPWDNPPAPPRVEDMSIIKISDGNNNYDIPPLVPSENFQTVEITLKDYLNQLDSLELQNLNTHRDILIRNIEIYNPEKSMGFEAVNPADTAQDALVEFNGIEIRRETNNIDDLIPGVQLELNRASDEVVDLAIEPDRELAKQNLIEFVFQYNSAMTRMLILSQDNTDLVDEIEYFTDDERDKAMEDLGGLRGNLTLMQLKTRLQSIVTAPYETRQGNALALLTQLGISSNETGGGGYNASKLRGYLEVDENQLDQALKGDMLAIKELFGKDSDGDLLMDSGIGVQMDNYLRAFTQTGGIIAMKNDRIDNQIDSQNDDIEEFKSYLEDYEDDLRKEYGQMDGMLNQLENSSNSLDNMFNQGNN
ncbi:MAG: flagellar filament capping protein FliD [Spirochaetaceae bacterium]|jgi:flagellar hook-associated protein 2|nr:flagellar filament capping protein FliD [Spirochaetaceae bacterium]